MLPLSFSFSLNHVHRYFGNKVFIYLWWLLYFRQIFSTHPDMILSKRMYTSLLCSIKHRPILIKKNVLVLLGIFSWRLLCNVGYIGCCNIWCDNEFWEDNDKSRSWEIFTQVFAFVLKAWLALTGVKGTALKGDTKKQQMLFSSSCDG